MTLQDLAAAKNELRRQEKEIDTLRTQNQGLTKSLDRFKEESLSASKRGREDAQDEVRRLRQQLTEANLRLDEELKAQDQKSRSITIHYIDQCTVAKREAQQSQQQLSEAREQLRNTERASEKLKAQFDKVQFDYGLLTARCDILATSNKKLEEMMSSISKERDLLKAEAEDRTKRIESLERTGNVAKKLLDEKDQLTAKFRVCQKEMKESGTVGAKADVKRLHEKYKRLKSRAIELRDLAAKYEDDLGKSRRNVLEVKATYEKLSAGLQEEIRKLKEDHKHAEYDKDVEHQRNVSEIQSKHVLELAQLQDEYQRLHDSQLKETQTQMQTEKDDLTRQYEEFKKSHEDYVAQVEANWFSPDNHNKLMGEAVARARAEKDAEIGKLREDLETKQRSWAATAEKRIQEHKADLDKLDSENRKIVGDLQTKLATLEKAHAESEALRQQVTKESRKRADEVSDMSRSAGEGRRVLDAERQKRKELEGQVEATGRELAELAEKHRMVQKKWEEAERELEAAGKEMKRAEEEKGGLSKKLDAVSAELEALQHTFSREQEKSKRENEAVAQALDESQNGQETLRKTLQETREKDSAVIEQETAQHMETKTQLIAAQDRIKSLAADSDRLRAALAKSDQDCKAIQAELVVCAKKRGEAERELQTTREDLDQEKILLEQQRQVFARLGDGLRKLVRDDLAGARKGVKEIREQLGSMKAETVKSSETSVERVVTAYRKLMARREGQLEASLEEEKSACQNQLQTVISEKEKEYERQRDELVGKYEEQIKDRKAEIQHYQGLCSELEGKSKELFQNVQELQARLRETEEAHSVAEKENKGLKHCLADATANFENCKKEASSCIMATKSQAEDRIGSVVTKLQSDHNSTLGKLAREIDGVKSAAVDSIRTVLGDVENMRTSQQREMAAVIQGYEDRLREADARVLFERSRAQKHEIELDELRMELDNITGQYRSLQTDLESRVKQLNKSSMMDTEKITKLKATRRGELESMQAEVRQLRSQLLNKNSVKTSAELWHRQ